MKTLRKRAYFKAINCKYERRSSEFFNSEVGFKVTLLESGHTIGSWYPITHPSVFRAVKALIRKQREVRDEEG